MQRSETRSNTVVPWLADTPNHWRIWPLKYCADLIKAKSDEKTTTKFNVALENIESWTGNYIPSEDGEETVFSNLFNEGDVLFGKLRPYLAKVFRATQNGSCSSELLVLRPRLVLQDYLFYYMLSPGFISVVNSSTYGAKMPRANWDFVSRLPLLLPPKDEQRSICEILNSRSKWIDAMIYKKKMQLKLLREQSDALIAQKLSKGLNPKATLKDSGIAWLGQVPAHWQIIRTKYLFSIKNGATPKTGEPSYWDGPIHWVTPNDLGKLDGAEIFETERTITEQGYESCGTVLVPPGSLVMSTRAPIGHLGIAMDQICTNQGCHTLVPRGEEWMKFFYYLFRIAHQELESWGQGSTFTELSRGKLENIWIVKPPISEQTAIAKELDILTGTREQSMRKIRESIKRLEEYRLALIYSAISGETIPKSAS
jgi:type I restriction enzyme S subunit